MALVHPYLSMRKMKVRQYYEDTKSAIFEGASVERRRWSGSNRVCPHGGLRRSRGRRNYARRVRQHQPHFFKSRLGDDRLGVAELEEISL